MQLTSLYISPHFDDVVFSCAGKIIEDIENGVRVIVATIFSESNDDNLEAYKARSQENDNALMILGAEGCELGYSDAPFRQPFYNSFRAIILERHPEDDEELVKSIGTSLNALCDRFNPNEVYAPLGVGTHIDHRLTFEAVNEHLSIPVIYYEDRPYVFTTHAVKARGNELGIQFQSDAEYLPPMSQFEIVTHLLSLSSMPYVKEYLPVGTLRDECNTLMRERMEASYKSKYKGVRTVREYPSHYLTQAMKSSIRYKSQFEDFLGSIDSHKIQIGIYSEVIAASQNYAEQYWSLYEI
jgi:LmbE family N-acetylglucosaminyl deacetylase